MSVSEKSGWWPSEVGYFRLDEYVCGIFAKSSRNLSRYLCDIEDVVYGGDVTARDAVWLSYLRFAVSLLVGIISLIFFGIIGALVREHHDGASIFLTGMAFFLAVLRGQLSVAAGLDLLLLFGQSKISFLADRISFVDMYRKGRFVFALAAILLLWWLYVSGNLAVAAGL